MPNKFQVGTVGGIRKVINTKQNASTATTIQGLENTSISIAQLKTLLGNTVTTQVTNPGSPAAGTSALTVTNGTTSVANVTVLDVPAGINVSAPGGNTAVLAIPLPLTVSDGTHNVTSVSNLLFQNAVNVSSTTAGYAKILMLPFLDVTDGSTNVTSVGEIIFSGASVSTTSTNTSAVKVTITAGSLTVTDLSTAATSITELIFSGASVSTTSTNTSAAKVTITSSGGGGGYPLNYVQWYPFESGASNATTYTVVFPQTAAASGNTLFMIIAADGSSTFTAPSGWTVDFNQQQSSYARLILMHKTSANDTSAVLTIGTAATFSGFMFEVSGAHALDKSSTNGTANQQFLQMSGITPSVGAAVFGAMAYVSNTTIGYAQANEVPGSPTWKTNYIQPNGSVAGRGLLLASYSQPGANALVTPPYLNFPAWAFFSGGGLAYGTFSIL